MKGQVVYGLIAIVGIILYTGIYGCGCDEKFEITEYKVNTKTMSEVKKLINSKP